MEKSKGAEVSQVEVSQVEVPVPKKKRVPSEKQMEGLRKGQEAIKKLAEKRKEIMERNKIRDAKKLLGQEVSDDDEEVPKGYNSGIPKTKKIKPETLEENVKKMKPKIEQVRPKVSLARRDDIESVNKKVDALMSMMSQMSVKPEPPKEIVKEVVREVPTERVVIKERRMSGSALLDKIFFNKDY